MTANDAPTPSEMEYFQEIERIFVRLRGAPLLLSPTDYQIASGWHEAGVPLDLIERALEKIFLGRLERGSKNPVQSLRYCRRGVESAWAEWQELQGTGARAQRPAVAIEPRLEALCGSLPADLPDRAKIVAEIRSLGGDPQEVERRLAAIESRWLELLWNGLESRERETFQSGVNAALRRLAGRFEPEQRQELEIRLLRQSLRRSLKLPTLSLFAPQPGG